MPSSSFNGKSEPWWRGRGAYNRWWAQRVRIPAGSQSGRQMRLKGKGMPAIKTVQKGDMFIEMAVETPVNLTARQKELLQEFEELSEDNNPETNSFFPLLNLLGVDEGLV